MIYKIDTVCSTHEKREKCVGVCLDSVKKETKWSSSGRWEDDVKINITMWTELIWFRTGISEGHREG